MTTCFIHHLPAASDRLSNNLLFSSHSLTQFQQRASYKCVWILLVLRLSASKRHWDDAPEHFAEKYVKWIPIEFELCAHFSYPLFLSPGDISPVCCSKLQHPSSVCPSPRSCQCKTTITSLLTFVRPIISISLLLSALGPVGDSSLAGRRRGCPLCTCFQTDSGFARGCSTSPISLSLDTWGSRSSSDAVISFSSSVLRWDNVGLNSTDYKRQTPLWAVFMTMFTILCPS